MTSFLPMEIVVDDDSSVDDELTFPTSLLHDEGLINANLGREGPIPYEERDDIITEKPSMDEEEEEEEEEKPKRASTKKSKKKGSALASDDASKKKKKKRKKKKKTAEKVDTEEEMPYTEEDFPEQQESAKVIPESSTNQDENDGLETKDNNITFPLEEEDLAYSISRDSAKLEAEDTNSLLDSAKLVAHDEAREAARVAKEQERLELEEEARQAALIAKEQERLERETEKDAKQAARIARDQDRLEREQEAREAARIAKETEQIERQQEAQVVQVVSESDRYEREEADRLATQAAAGLLLASSVVDDETSQASTPSRSNCKVTNHANNKTKRGPDLDDGTDQPISSQSPPRRQVVVQNEGAKAQAILDAKAHSLMYDENLRIRPGAFRVEGNHGTSSNGDMMMDDSIQDIRDVIVTAKVSSNDHEEEALIEDRVRQRLLKETARASIVFQEHGGSSSKYEDPIADAQRRAQLEKYKPQGLKEKIIGDGKHGSLNVGANPDEYIKKRHHLPWTVKLNSATNLWVASVQTNQKAWESSQLYRGDEKSQLELKRSIQPFVGKTERAAYEVGLAMAPPLMQAFDENPICFMCKTKFALLKKPCNCRNCGVVVCSSCTCNWTAKQVPTTYNTSKKSAVTVCLACDWLASSFRQALLKGDEERARRLYETGNVNLRNQNGGKKKSSLGDEALYPVQSAVLGGNLSLIKWLIYEHFCPLYNTDTNKQSKGCSLLLSSKGRSVIDLALQQHRPEILKFLVSDQGLSLLDGTSKEQNCDSLKHLMCLLAIIPDSLLDNVVATSEPRTSMQQQQARPHLGSF